MRVIEGRNVNSVYAQLVRMIRKEGVLQSSRAGEVLVLDSPVMLVTHRPTERVLLDPKRDSNPFFTLMESLFLLAGRDDYTWLDRFVRNFSSSFAEPNGLGHGSYGYRWRQFWSYDQLNATVDALRKNPEDRRVVISMWSARRDSGVALQEARDIPCNTHIYPRIVGGALDLTVCCRSNDAIWGATGANAVQFSMLLEYLAGRIGVQPGILYQLANNMHAYTARLDRYGEPTARHYWPDAYDDPEPMATVPIGTDWEHWDEDLQRFMEIVDGVGLEVPEPSIEDWSMPRGSWTPRNPWFVTVAFVVWAVHARFAEGKKQSALEMCSQIVAPDWRLACERWIQRRMK